MERCVGPFGSHDSVARVMRERGRRTGGAENPRKRRAGPRPLPGGAGNEWAARVLQKSPPSLLQPRSPSPAAVTGRRPAGPRSKHASERGLGPSRRGALAPRCARGAEAPRGPRTPPLRGSRPCSQAPAPEVAFGCVKPQGPGRETTPPPAKSLRPPRSSPPTLPPFSRSTAVSL